MARNLPNLKLKSVVSDSDSSDNENETKDTGKNLDLSLEKLNLGPKKKLLVLNLGGLLVDRVHRPNESAVRRYGGAIFKRPFCDQFLKFCLERFEVGLWSSARELVLI
uniref:Mitochondrial import inner membrane translocase subunit TIM50 n=1 Tax=Nicotiana tabacum TaxID=4097 RepID=A0A1S3WYY5_TOBAC|nr:PREDICTED: uncharacterized protein LOC107759423 [Nicotiana tabacum]